MAIREEVKVVSVNRILINAELFLARLLYSFKTLPKMHLISEIPDPAA
jgi:hypothetical protein